MGAAWWRRMGSTGIFIPDGYTLIGKGQIAGGSLSLQPGARLVLPSITTGDSAISINADLSRDSARAATLILSWEGSSTAALTVTLAADTTGLQFRIGPKGVAIIVPAGGSEKTFAVPAAEIQGANLLAAIENPQEAKSALVIDQVLATKVK